MGVSGSGKSTVAKSLASKLKAEYVEADAFHSPENKMLMIQGIPLRDNNRWPWLESLNKKLLENQDRGHSSVLACSALKEIYRKKLSREITSFYTVFLHGPYGFIGERLGKRKDHFFKADLLKSQFDDLEEPKNAWRFSVERFSSEEISKRVLEKLGGIQSFSKESGPDLKNAKS